MRFRRFETKNAFTELPAICERTGLISLNGHLTGLIQIDNALFIALAEYAKGILAHVPDIQTDYLGYTQPAVEKKTNYAIIALAVDSVNGIQ